jgi:hypothetical protein
MRSLPRRRAARPGEPPRAPGFRPAPPVALFSLASLVAGVIGACSVDQQGLETVSKLSRDAATPGTGGVPSSGTGGAPATGTGGSSVTGTGGSPATGGAGLGSGGAATGGSAGSGGTGGEPAGTGGSGAGGTGGGAGTVGQGGTTGSGGMGGGTPIGGGAGQGAGGAAGAAAGGAGGSTGTGGVIGTGGTGGRGGTVGGRCSSLTCFGCCSNGVCVTSTNNQQCGSHGGSCTACGACQTCSGTGSCEIDPQSQWTIVAAGAQVTMSPPGGGTWDPLHGDEGGTAPDLFCEFENPSGTVTPTTAGVTGTIIDTYSASWNQTITPSGVTISASALMAAKPAWRIWVGDEDCSRTNVCTSGQIVCSYQQPFTAAQLMNGSASLNNVQSCQSLDLQLICASGP